MVCTKRSLIGGRGLYRRGGRFRRPAQKGDGIPQGWEVYSDSFSYTDGGALYGSYYDHSENVSGGVRVDLATGEYTVFETGGDSILGVSGSSFLMRHYEYPLDDGVYPRRGCRRGRAGAGPADGRMAGAV